MKRIVIIGGGITGLAAAHKVLERAVSRREPIQLTLLEAGRKPGGTIQTKHRDGFQLERGPDSFISEKPEGVELAKRLGLEPHLIETNQEHRRSFVVRQGRLLSVPKGFNLLAPARFWPFVTSGIFSMRGKARMAMDLLLPRRQLNSAADESLAQFVRRRFGREALERMAQPMVGGIYTADPETLSLRATMPRFLEMERKHRSLILALRKAGSAAADDAELRGSSPTPGSPAGQPGWGGTVRAGADASGARYSLFLSFDRGMQSLTDKLVERISSFASQVLSGVNPTDTIQLNTTVESLESESETAGERRWKIRTNRGDTLVADAVCLALPSYASAGLLRSTDADLASELDRITYASSATINLAYRREDIPHPLDGFGFVVPYIEKRTLMACTFSSVKFPGRAPEGYALLRAFVGGALQPELVSLTDDELVARVRDDLGELLHIQGPPLFTEVSKWERSMPQYKVGHLDLMKGIEKRLASLPGLALAGNAYSGPGIPDCIRGGEAASSKLINAVVV